MSSREVTADRTSADNDYHNDHAAAGRAGGAGRRGRGPAGRPAVYRHGPRRDVCQLRLGSGSSHGVARPRRPDGPAGATPSLLVPLIRYQRGSTITRGASQFGRLPCLHVADGLHAIGAATPIRPQPGLTAFSPKHRDQESECLHKSPSSSLQACCHTPESRASLRRIVMESPTTWSFHNLECDGFVMRRTRLGGVSYEEGTPLRRGHRSSAAISPRG
jgi:hypothetical protein